MIALSKSDFQAKNSALGHSEADHGCKQKKSNPESLIAIFEECANELWFGSLTYCEFVICSWQPLRESAVGQTCGALRRSVSADDHGVHWLASGQMQSLENP